MGPVIFTLYTSPLVVIIKKYDLYYHFYADDTQLFLSFDVKDESSLNEAIKRMETCVLEIKHWMCEHFVKLNDDKSEVLVITSPHYQEKLPNLKVTIDTCNIPPAPSTRNIGVIFYNTCQMKDHITHICRTSFQHVRRIASIRKYITEEACIILVRSFITSRIDYCNSLFAGLPQNLLAKLQHLLHIMARIVIRAKKFETITPTLASLHWLPIAQRIKYKVLILTFKCVNKTAPIYLCELIQPYQPARPLRSAESFKLVVPWAKTLMESVLSVFMALLYGINFPLKFAKSTTLSLLNKKLRHYYIKKLSTISPRLRS